MMFKKILIAGVAGSLAIAGAFYAVPAAAQSSGSSSVAIVVPVEKHPILRRSINQLNNIEGELARAADDFQGHKEQARDLIRKAIDQLNLAIQSDKH